MAIRQTSLCVRVCLCDVSSHCEKPDPLTLLFYYSLTLVFHTDHNPILAHVTHMWLRGWPMIVQTDMEFSLAFGFSSMAQKDTSLPSIDSYPYHYAPEPLKS